MHTLIWIAILAVFVFLLTYDPSSRKLEKYIAPRDIFSPSLVPEKEEETKTCSSERYQNLIFGQSSGKNACAGETKEYKGAVI